MDQKEALSKQLAYIEPSTILEIKVSGYFYKKLQTIFLYKLGKLPKDDMKATLDRIKTGKPPVGPEEFELQTLAGLIIAIEKEARDKDKIAFKSVEDTLKDIEKEIVIASDIKNQTQAGANESSSH